MFVVKPEKRYERFKKGTCRRVKWDSRGRLGTQGWEIWDTSGQMGQDVLSTLYVPRNLILSLLIKRNHTVKTNVRLAFF